MGKAKTCFDEHIVNSDDFLGLTIESQCLYLHLGFDSDSIGELAGVRRLARGYGFGADELEELRGAGYLLEVDGRWFITHYYEHNNLPSNDGMKQSVANLWAKRPDGLAFEDGICRSKYTVSHELAEQQANISEVLASKGKGTGKDTDKGIRIGKGTDTDKVPATSPKESTLGRVGVSGEGEPSFPPCPICDEFHDIEGEEGMEHMRCPSSMRTYWLEGNEWR